MTAIGTMVAAATRSVKESRPRTSRQSPSGSATDPGPAEEAAQRTRGRSEGSPGSPVPWRTWKRMATQPWDAFQSRLGRKTRIGHRPAEPGPGGAKLAAQVAVEEHEEEERRGEQRGGVLGEEREPHQRRPAAIQPLPRARATSQVAAGVGRLHRRVGQRQPAGEHEDGGGGGEQRGHGRGPRVVAHLAGDERRRRPPPGAPQATKRMRTPVSPGRIAVEARMSQATMGGWSK